ncbi:MAG TPA: polyprenyl synthetase family protein, partial [Elusimicrobiota bacterium]|nr:polyprenyl synthetase family protein [Elusimicrobiota bacterium]
MVDKALDRFMTKEEALPPVVHKAMRYSVFAGGKRLRPVLCLAAAEITGGKPARVLPTACALEVIHTYSLVHDDLPAMDDDDLRRGRPTNHRVFGEGVAILAGDGLLTYGFELMAKNARVAGVRAERVVEAIGTVARAVGSQGMVGGQAVDLESEG